MPLEYGALDDTFYFHFAANDTGGSGADGATPTCDVRLCGAAVDAAPVYSPTPTLLTNAGYPAGAHEVAIVASAANGFTAGNTYAVFCTLLVDSENPTGFVGKFKLDRQQVHAAEITDGLITANAIANGAIDNATFAADVGSTAYATNIIALAADKTIVERNLDDVPTILTGITSLAAWLRGLFRKDTMNATAKSEVNNGGGSYDESTDSNEAVRDTAPLGTAMRGTDSAALASAYTADRGGYLDKLNVGAEVLANTGNASSFKATGFSTHGPADVAALVLATPAQKLVTDGSGRVTVGTNGDKADYALTGAYDAAKAAASGTALAGVAADAELARKLAEADKVVDTAGTPWVLSIKEKGTETELSRKELKQVDGSPVTSTDHIVGQEIEEE